MATIFRPSNARQAFEPKTPFQSVAAPTPTARGGFTGGDKAPAAPQNGPGRRYVNLTEWAGLNREQADAANTRVASKLQQTAEGASNAQAGTREAFGRASDAGTVKFDSQTFDPNLRNSGTARAASMRSYSGPTQLNQVASYADTAAQTANAAQQLGMTDQQLRRQEFGQGQYGAGEQGLDNFLMQGDTRTQALRERYGNLTGDWAQLEKDAANTVTANTATSNASAGAYGAAADKMDRDADETQRKAVAASGDQWMRDNGVTAMVQQAWRAAGSPPLGEWLRVNSPELFKKYSTETGTTSPTQGLKGTPNKPARTTSTQVELN